MFIHSGKYFTVESRKLGLMWTGLCPSLRIFRVIGIGVKMRKLINILRKNIYLLHNTVYTVQKLKF
jgi:hypothetical protein